LPVCDDRRHHTGALGSGVKLRRHFIKTETIVMRSVTGTVRIIRGQRRQPEKFHLD
jgi:fructose-1,6-bisphosphatase II / sedoheptulose-1,7-bisphosphatase